MSYEKLENCMNGSASQTDVVPSETHEEKDSDARSHYKEVLIRLYKFSIYPRFTKSIPTDGLSSSTFSSLWL
jgi:hypothetical protein